MTPRTLAQVIEGLAAHDRGLSFVDGAGEERCVSFADVRDSARRTAMQLLGSGPGRTRRHHGTWRSTGAGAGPGDPTSAAASGGRNAATSTRRGPPMPQTVRYEH